MGRHFLFSMMSPASRFAPLTFKNYWDNGYYFLVSSMGIVFISYIANVISSDWETSLLINVRERQAVFVCLLFCLFPTGRKMPADTKP